MQGLVRHEELPGGLSCGLWARPLWCILNFSDDQTHRVPNREASERVPSAVPASPTSLLNKHKAPCVIEPRSPHPPPWSPPHPHPHSPLWSFTCTGALPYHPPAPAAACFSKAQLNSCSRARGNHWGRACMLAGARPWVQSPAPCVAPHPCPSTAECGQVALALLSRGT